MCRFPLLSAKFVGYLLTRVLEYGAFFLQFLQYWHMGDQHRTSLTALPVPPPFEVLLSKFSCFEYTVTQNTVLNRAS